MKWVIILVDTSKGHGFLLQLTKNAGSWSLWYSGHSGILSLHNTRQQTAST